MRILAVDIGTGTQDILLFDSTQPIENSIQLILPSPTLVIAGRIRQATAAGRAVLLDGTTMGGGPSHWAAENHLCSGLPVYATPPAAATFDDDPARVAEMGVTLIDQADAARIEAGGAERITMRDFDPGAIMDALAGFGVSRQVDALCVAVFDHGNSPPGYSDRSFRFDYLAERLATGGRDDLTAFGFMRDDIPPSMTRLRAAAESPQGALAELPLLAMDTGPAAILGALEDPEVAVVTSGPRSGLIVNIGNFHTLAFHRAGGRIKGLFEHHTGELTGEQLVGFLERLVAGTLTNAEIFDSMGHGALVLDPSPSECVLCAVTGPRRKLLPVRMPPAPLKYVVPHGDMMLTGCFGLLRALARHWPPAAEPVAAVLDAE
ncbi:MAG: DUF1786 domain-containing protein [Chloroflexia bacterium]